MSGSGHTGTVPDAQLSAVGLIRLEIPAHGQYLATARLVATSAGADAGFNVDDLADLRLGVDELVALLIARSVGEGTRIALEVEVEDKRVVVTGEIDGEVDPSADPADELSQRIVAAVVDAHELSERAFRLEKSATRAR